MVLLPHLFSSHSSVNTIQTLNSCEGIIRQSSEINKSEQLTLFSFFPAKNKTGISGALE